MFVEGIIVTHCLVFSVELPAALIVLGWPFFKIYFFYDNIRMTTKSEATCAILGLIAGICPACQLFPIIGEKVAAIATWKEVPIFLRMYLWGPFIVLRLPIYYFFQEQCGMIPELVRSCNCLVTWPQYRN